MSDASTSAHLGVGWSFPVRPQGGSLSYARYEEDVDQAISLILLTSPGERPMLPEFGGGLSRFVFEPNSPATHRAIEQAVKRALLDWEPRITTDRIDVLPDERMENLLRIHIDYTVRATNSFYNRVFPFFLSEGRA
jgi:phage baseplate assembly protein W